MTPQPTARALRRAVFVNRFYFPDESATSQILTDLARDLAGRGWDVTVITSRSANTSERALPLLETDHGVRIVRVRATHFGRRTTLHRIADFASFYPVALGALLRELRRGDVVVAKTDPPLVSAVAALAASIRGARLVNWLQDLYPEVAHALGEPLARGPLTPLLKAVRNWSLRRAALNVAIGVTMRARIAEIVPSDTRLEVVPNWTSEEAIEPIAAANSRARARWGYSEKDVVICYSGNLGRAHEADTLLGAMDLLRHRTEVHFLMIGGGVEYARLQREAAHRGLPRLRFEPHQPREALADSLAAGDIHWLSLRPELEGLIVPSKFYGILAAARPVVAVVAADGEIANEIARLGCGIVVTPGDSSGLAQAIITLTSNPNLRSQMGEAGRRGIVGELSKRASLDRWHSLLSGVTAETRR